MRLARVRVQNYRGLQDVTVDIDTETVLVGENNSGKTSFLEALRACLQRLRSRRSAAFDSYDFYLANETATPSNAPPIIITITFEEPAAGEWPANLLQALSGLTTLGAADKQSVILRVTARVDGSTGEVVSEWEFLDVAGNALTTREARTSGLSTVQAIELILYLTALRDAAQHFDSRGQFWRPFLRDGSIDVRKREEIEAALQELNDLIVASHDTFARVRENLERVQKVVVTAAGNTVAIDALPIRGFDLLTRTQVSFAAPGGARIPVARHGEGTQSLAVLLLFDAFLRARLESEADPLAEPILAMEEPEAHLHPNAVRSLYRLLKELLGQKVIATHSGDLLSEVDISSVRRFARTGSGVAVYRLRGGTLNGEEHRKFNYHVRSFRAELLFARCWLLVEGETEITVLTEASRQSGYDLVAAGVRCVEFAKAEPVMFIKIANDLGIPCHYVLDGDSKGEEYRARLVPSLQGTPEADCITRLAYVDIEHLLCESGFGNIYLKYVPASRTGEITVAPGHADYWNQVLAAAGRNLTKPRAASEVAAAMQGEPPRPVPPSIRQILDKAVELARR